MNCDARAYRFLRKWFFGIALIVKGWMITMWWETAKELLVGAQPCVDIWWNTAPRSIFKEGWKSTTWPGGEDSFAVHLTPTVATCSNQESKRCRPKPFHKTPCIYLVLMWLADSIIESIFGRSRFISSLNLGILISFGNSSPVWSKAFC